MSTMHFVLRHVKVGFYFLLLIYPTTNLCEAVVFVECNSVFVPLSGFLESKNGLSFVGRGCVK